MAPRMKPAIETPKTATEISLRVVGLIVALLSHLYLGHYEDLLPAACYRTAPWPLFGLILAEHI
jgi:hypothetical protein